MKYEQLLEKKEAKQLVLLQQLMLRDGEVTSQWLSNELGISKASLETYIADLIDTLKAYNGGINLSYDGQSVALRIENEFSLNQVERDFFLSSIKYRILEYVFEHHEFSTVALSQSLKLSESTLFRKIKEINILLEEFDISIWQGRLVGEESQIRYFYFQFYWFLSHNQLQVVSKRSLPYIKMIEKGLGIHLTENSRLRMGLWMKLAKKRINAPHQEHQKMREKSTPFLRDPFYTKVRDITIRAFGHYAVEIEEEESMLHFSFLISMSILSADDFYDYSLIRSRFTPTAMMDTLALESIVLYYKPLILSRKLEAHLYFLLAQIHPMLYFFKGDIEIYDRLNIWKLEEELSGHSIQPLTDHLLDMCLERFNVHKEDQNSLVHLTKIKYLSVLAIIDYQTSREIRVGISLEMEELFKEATTNMFIVQLKSLNGVICETYNSDKSYDLVITNQSYLESDAQKYVISELGTQFDMKQIKETIRRIYNTKNQVTLPTIIL